MASNVGPRLIAACAMMIARGSVPPVGVDVHFGCALTSFKKNPDGTVEVAARGAETKTLTAYDALLLFHVTKYMERYYCDEEVGDIADKEAILMWPEAEISFPHPEALDVARKQIDEPVAIRNDWIVRWTTKTPRAADMEPIEAVLFYETPHCEGYSRVTGTYHWCGRSMCYMSKATPEIVDAFL